MCPFCIGTAIWIAAGAVAAGGATVTAAKLWNRKTQHEQGGENDEQ